MTPELCEQLCKVSPVDLTAIVEGFADIYDDLANRATVELEFRREVTTDPLAAEQAAWMRRLATAANELEAAAKRMAHILTTAESGEASPHE